MDQDYGRRSFLKAAGLVAAVGMTGLAGCSGSGGTVTGETPTGPKLANEPNYKGYLDNVSNYDHTIDLRDEDAVTIGVGTKGNMGDFGFEPAAAAVAPGTTVTWEWTGRGGGHNVVASQGTFNSGPPVEAAGTTFEYTFDKPGVYTYACEPHEAMGMRGAIFVALADAQASHEHDHEGRGN